jgi:hypothetical protein
MGETTVFVCFNFDAFRTAGEMTKRFRAVTRREDLKLTRTGSLSEAA